MLRATTACTFSTSQLPKVFRPVPTMVCFVSFDLEMCFAPQRRALFQHLNFQKWSEPWCALHILTWKCASRHKGVQLFISHLARWLRVAALASLLFNPPEPQIIGKTQCREFPTFSCTWIFFLQRLSLF